jgi:hypothetical protein
MIHPIQYQILHYLIVSVDALIEKGREVARRCAEEASVKCLILYFVDRAS